MHIHVIVIRLFVEIVQQIQWRTMTKTNSSNLIESRRQQRRELEFNLRQSLTPLT